MHRAATRRGARRPSVVAPSCNETILYDLQEHTARLHSHAIIISPVYFAKFPAAIAVVEVLKKAVSGATPCVCLNGIPAVLLE